MKHKIFIAPSHQGVSRAELVNGAWKVETHLQDKQISCLASDPQRTEVVYAGSKEHGVLVSEDAGKSWAPTGMQGHPVKSLAVSSHDPNVIYAGTKPALIFKSTDGGSTWHELEDFRRIPNRWWWFSPADPPDRRPYVYAISVSPTEPEVVLAGVEFGAVVRSEDGGKTWGRHLSGALRDCHSLKFHAVDGNWAYEAGGTGGGASFSRDGGRTWQKAKRGLAKNYGVVCASDSLKPEIWYVCVAPSPFKAFSENPEIYLYRANGGAGWHPIGWEAHPLSGTPSALVTVPDETGLLYAGLSNGDVWSTSDYGDNWERMPFNLGSIWNSLIII